EHRREHARAVRAGQAHPLHATGRRDQAVDLAVREKRILGDGRKWAGDAWLEDLRPDLEDRLLAVAVRRWTNRMSEVGFLGFAGGHLSLNRGYADGSPDAPENLLLLAEAGDVLYRYALPVVVVRDQVTGGHDAPCLLADRRAARDLSTQDVARGQVLQAELLLDPRRLGALAAARRSEDDADHWPPSRILRRRCHHFVTFSDSSAWTAGSGPEGSPSLLSSSQRRVIST